MGGVEQQREKQLGFLSAAAVLLLSLFSGAAVTVNAPGESLTPPSAREAAPGGGASIRIDVEQLPPGEQIQLGAFPMQAGTACEALLSWEGGAQLTVECRPGKAYPLTSGQPTSFTIPADGLYSFPICNRDDETALALQGTVRSYQDPDFTPEDPSVSQTSFSIPVLAEGEEQAGALYALEAGGRLRLTARVEEGTLTARLVLEEGASGPIPTCHLKERSSQELAAGETGVYRLTFTNEGTEPVLDAVGIITRMERP